MLAFNPIKNCCAHLNGVVYMAVLAYIFVAAQMISLQCRGLTATCATALLPTHQSNTFLRICDWLCKKGSYSFSKFSTLVNHISSSFKAITFILHQAIVLCYRSILGTTFKVVSNLYISQVTKFQIRRCYWDIYIYIAVV